MNQDWRRNPDAEAMTLAIRAFRLKSQGLSYRDVATELGFGLDKAIDLVRYGRRWDEGNCPYCGRALP